MRTKSDSYTKGAPEELVAFDAGVAEVNRMSQALNSLMGERFHKDASGLLRDISLDLLRYLVDHTRSTEAARALLIEHEPRAGFRFGTPVTNDVELVLGLLNSIRSAASCEKADFVRLILGDREVRRRRGNSKGGKKGAATKVQAANDRWQERAIATRTKLLRGGEDPRKIATRVAEQYGRSPSAVRRLFAKQTRA